MRSQEAIDRIRYKLDQTEITNTFFNDVEILNEVNAARRELARLLPVSMFPRLIRNQDVQLSGGVGLFPEDYLDVYPQGYTLIDGKQADLIDPILLPNLTRNLNTAPGVDNKYYFVQAGKVYAFPVNSQTVSFQYYAYPMTLVYGYTLDVIDLPEDVNDLAVDLAFAALNATERGNLNISQITRASVIDKVNALAQQHGA